jgi:hypothetical protein
MRNGDVALRLSIVFSIAGFIALAAGLYEIDRRERSSSGTAAANLAAIEHRLQNLSDQIRILNNQHTAQLAANDVQVQALSNQMQTLNQQLNLGLKELEKDLRVRRSESVPARR